MKAFIIYTSSGRRDAEIVQVDLRNRVVAASLCNQTPNVCKPFHHAAAIMEKLCAESNEMYPQGNRDLIHKCMVEFVD
jgi:hypothetical protein